MTISARISVDLSPADAFARFVGDLGTWWPVREGYSFGGAQVVDLVMEEHEGGRFYEVREDGTEHEIGRVVVFDPPERLLFTWRDPEWPESTDVEVRFDADGDATIVAVEHRGFTFAGGQTEAAGYRAGWELVLDRFATHAEGGS